MIFNESVCFEISASGKKADVERLVSYLRSGGVDDFFEVEDEFFLFEDGFEEADPDTQVSILFSSDEFGIEVDEFDPDDFLEMICKVAKPLYLSGNFYNFDDEEYRFISETGDSYYINSDKFTVFNDEIDAEIRREAAESDSEDEDY